VIELTPDEKREGVFCPDSIKEKDEK